MLFVFFFLIIIDGLKFYRSANNVILCSGDENGFLKTKYFLKVVDVKTKDLLFE